MASPETQSQIGVRTMEPLEHFLARVRSHAFIPPVEKIVMAKPVKLPKGKEFTFARGVQSKYPWDEWFNGELLLIERSTGEENEKGTIVNVSEKRDFEVQREAMVPKLKTAARKRYKVCEFSRRDHEGNILANDGLIIRARDMTDEEKAEENELRAEEKAARKAALAAKAEANGPPT